MSISSRISIPGGTCEFDLPAYYAWQQLDPARRRGDLLQWVGTLMPLAEALQVLLGLLRDSGAPQRVVAIGGQYSQSLPAGRVYQLLRVRIDPALQLVPEISGHRLMVLVRLMRQEADGRLQTAQRGRVVRADAVRLGGKMPRAQVAPSSRRAWCAARDAAARASTRCPIRTDRSAARAAAAATSVPGPARAIASPAAPEPDPDENEGDPPAG